MYTKRSRDILMYEINRRIQRICEEALQRVLPSREEEIKTLKFTNFLIKKLNFELEKLGLEAEVRVEGSVAKNTWLAGEKDIDIFILIPKEQGRRGLVEALELSLIHI